MSGFAIVGLGAVAGFTIFLGLPLGRVRTDSSALRATLNAIAAGILVFLLWDVLAHSAEPVEEALLDAAHEGGSWARFAGLATVMTLGLGVGLVSLVYYDEWMVRRSGVPKAARVAVSVGAGAPAGVAGAGSGAPQPSPAAGRGQLLGLDDPARRLALLIAVGIGLHNFSEGLAIGQSAVAGEVSLALLLVVGFGLHNATEGFGIVGPLTGAPQPPSWGLLAVLGLIGGGPTFLGTLVGQSFVNEAVYLGFLALAAGSILYVVAQLLKVGFRLGHARALYWGLLGGLLLGFATDFFIAAVGA